MENKMKRILLSLLLIIASSAMAQEKTYLTTGTEAGQKEGEFIIALEHGNKAHIEHYIKEGASARDKLHLGVYQGVTPLLLAFTTLPSGANKDEILKYLISQGANPADLSKYLVGFAKAGDVAKIRWLLSLGVKDLYDEALEVAKYYGADEPDVGLKARYAEIAKILEQAKKGPVKLTPMVKPIAKSAAPAAPLKVEQPYISDAALLIGIAGGGTYKKSEAVQPAAAQPQPKAVLRPLTKPATAQPINK